MIKTTTQVIVDEVHHVYQFHPGHSQYMCEAYGLATLTAFAYPGKYIDLDLLAHTIYEKYLGAGADNSTDTMGMTKPQALDWLATNNVGIHDLQPIIDSGDTETLRHEMGAMNKCGIPVMLAIADESHLKLATNGQKLHSWNDVGMSHVIVRLGMELEQPIGYYLDPATSSPPFSYPTPILWEDILACRPITAIGVMPHKVPAPPESFRFYVNGTENVWPTPEPAINIADALNTLHSLKAANDAERQRLDQERQAADAAFLKIISDLGATV